MIINDIQGFKIKVLEQTSHNFMYILFRLWEIDLFKTIKFSAPGETDFGKQNRDRNYN